MISCLTFCQACLGEIKKDKGNEFVRVYVQINGQKFVIGMLSLERLPHLNLDLVFEDEFELSHDLKQGSVHFAGYKADDPVSYPFAVLQFSIRLLFHFFPMNLSILILMSSDTCDEIAVNY